jgi:hypothetical protein
MQHWLINCCCIYVLWLYCRQDRYQERFWLDKIRWLDLLDRILSLLSVCFDSFPIQHYMPTYLLHVLNCCDQLSDECPLSIISTFISERHTSSTRSHIHSKLVRRLLKWQIASKRLPLTVQFNEIYSASRSIVDCAERFRAGSTLHWASQTAQLTCPNAPFLRLISPFVCGKSRLFREESHTLVHPNSCMGVLQSRDCFTFV